jgi:hypothetical protein
MYLHPTSSTVPKTLNALSRSLLLHGLMSVAWDMQRRDQTSLGVLDSHPLGNWQLRLASSYSAWQADYSSFCTAYLARVPDSHPAAREFETCRAAMAALFHAANILLHTPFLDLQIYAGARHILGRQVQRADYVRSQRVVRTWVAEHPEQASTAAWHAASLVRAGVNVLDSDSETSGSRMWHLPWAVYLGTLVVWGVWYAGPHAGEEDEVCWDTREEMGLLLEGIVERKEEMGKKGVNALAAEVSRCLGKVRWAVVHDGMIVLRGLVQWRLVGGGGVGGG